jgi:hypothetical protein
LNFSPNSSIQNSMNSSITCKYGQAMGRQTNCSSKILIYKQKIHSKITINNSSNFLWRKYLSSWVKIWGWIMNNRFKRNPQRLGVLFIRINRSHLRLSFLMRISLKHIVIKKTILRRILANRSFLIWVFKIHYCQG